MTIRLGPAHFSNHSNFSSSFCCCVAGLFDRRVFDFLRLMRHHAMPGMHSPVDGEELNRSRRKHEISIKVGVSPEHADCQNLRPFLKGVRPGFWFLRPAALSNGSRAVLFWGSGGILRLPKGLARR